MATHMNPFHVGLNRGKRRTLAEIEAATVGYKSFSALRGESVRPVPSATKVSTWLSHQRGQLGGADFVDLDQFELAQPSPHSPALVNTGQERTSQRWQTHISLPRTAARPSHPLPRTPPSSRNFSSNGLKRKGIYSNDSDDDVIIVEPPPSVLSRAPRPVAFVDLTKSDRPKRQTSFLGNRDDDVIIIDPPAVEMRRQLRPLVLGTPQPARSENRPEARPVAQPEPRPAAQPDAQPEAQPEIRPRVRAEKRRKHVHRGVASAVERRAQQSIRSPSDETTIPEADTTEAEALLESIEAVTQFFTLATEIRDKIYRQLLVSPMPIRVHGLWTEVARRSTRRGARGDEVDNTIDNTIDTGILSVCRRTAVEATRILYSENTFFYLLRDPEVVENASGVRRSQRGVGRGRWDQESRPSINLAKYGHLIRHMIIELESNRTKTSYEKLMSAALETLTPAGAGSPLLPSPPRPPCAPIHLHTLTITISPLMQKHRTTRASASGNQDVAVHDGRFLTAVGFFSRGAPVLKALQRLNVDFLRINVHVNSGVKDDHFGSADAFFDPSEDGQDSDDDDDNSDDNGSDTASPRGARQRPRRRHLETTIDLRCLPRHMEALSRDGVMGHLWANDALMQERRRAQGAAAEQTLARLRRHIEDACLRPEAALRSGGIWEDHGAAERRRREQRAKEAARFDADAYDDAEDEDDSGEDQRGVRGRESLIISIARVGGELRAYRP